eukprot:superscaffoldBa00001819_g12162
MKKRFNINLDDSAFTKERAPPKPQFQPSSTKTACSSKPAPESVDHQPLSYAEYVVQSKSHVPAPLQREGSSSKLLRTDGDGGTSLKRSESESVPSASGRCEIGTESGFDGVKKSEETQVAGTDQTEGNGQSLSLGPKPVGSGSCIIVSPRQRGNPILKFVRSVPWEFGDVVPDYVLGQTTCALFLSPEEAGRYLETYKSYEKKPADLLKEQVEKDYLSKVTDCLTTVKSINKTDAITLLSTFSSVKGIISASKEDLVLCPGLGPQKARRLYDVLHKPFFKSKTKDS